MSTDPAIRDHKAWLGYLQPDGLVVSPAALVDSQVLLNRNAAPLQQTFLDHVEEIGDDGHAAWVVSDLKGLLTGFLEWPLEYLAGHDDAHPIPDELRVPLREFGETLKPTMAFRDPNPPEDASPWLLLLEELPRDADLDEPVESAMAGWSASHTRRFERLLREARVPIGLQCNGAHIRVVYAPRGENSGTLTFPVSAMVEIAGRPILSAFEMLFSSYRLLSAPSEARLPALLKRSRDYQARVSTALARQVLDALYELLRGFQVANDYNKNRELLREALANDPQSIYGGLLTTLMRLVFLLYAEDRGLMPGSDLYVRNYSVHSLFERLRSDAEHYPDTMDHRYGAWAQLVALFRAVYSGCATSPNSKCPRARAISSTPPVSPFSKEIPARSQASESPSETATPRKPWIRSTCPPLAWMREGETPGETAPPRKPWIRLKCPPLAGVNRRQPIWGWILPFRFRRPNPKPRVSPSYPTASCTGSSTSCSSSAANTSATAPWMSSRSAASTRP